MERAPASPRPAPCRWRPARPRPESQQSRIASGVTRSFLSRSVVASTTEVDGVIGYHATTVTPAKTAPMPQAALPSMMILPVVASSAR